MCQGKPEFSQSITLAGTFKRNYCITEITKIVENIIEFFDKTIESAVCYNKTLGVLNSRSKHQGTQKTVFVGYFYPLYIGKHTIEAFQKFIIQNYFFGMITGEKKFCSAIINSGIFHSSLSFRPLR